jgi:hypothetical protein
MELEIWKDVIGYEGQYQVSNLGNVKSLKFGKEKLLKKGINVPGYNFVNLYKNKTPKNISIHHLVIKTFLDDVFIDNKNVVDHINGIKTDNRLENLQIVTQRYNASKGKEKKKDKTSKYTGVSLFNNKWISQIMINKKVIILGYFDTELEAHISYKNKLKEIT